MNIKKLMRRAEEYLSSDERKRKEKRRYLKQVVRKLRQHEKALKHTLEECSDRDQCRQLKREIVLAHSQRKKGVTQLKALKKKK